MQSLSLPAPEIPVAEDDRVNNTEEHVLRTVHGTTYKYLVLSCRALAEGTEKCTRSRVPQEAAATSGALVCHSCCPPDVGWVLVEAPRGPPAAGRPAHFTRLQLASRPALARLQGAARGCFVVRAYFDFRSAPALPVPRRCFCPSRRAAPANHPLI